MVLALGIQKVGFRFAFYFQVTSFIIGFGEMAWFANAWIIFLSEYPCFLGLNSLKFWFVI